MMPAVSRMATVLRSSVLVLSAIQSWLRKVRGVAHGTRNTFVDCVLSSTQPSLCSLLTAAQASAASALGCVAAFVRAAALSLAAGLPCRWRLVLAS